MAVTFSSLRGEVLRHAVEVPIVLAMDVLRESAREFFTKSKAWVETYDMDLVALQSEYNLKDHTNNASFPYTVSTASFDADVVAWHDVVVDGTNHLTKLTTAGIAKRAPFSLSSIAGYATAQPHICKLYGTPGAAQAGQTLSMSVSLCPSRTADNIAADRMVDLYKDPIVSGALMRLFLMPRQPWTNASLAAVHNELFKSGILQASNDVQSEYTQRITRTTKYGGI